MADMLVIHDQTHLRQWLLEHMGAGGHRVSGAVDLDQARVAAASTATDYAVVVMGVPRGAGLAMAIHQVKQAWAAAEIVMIGASQDLNDATEAVRQGAYDYLGTPVEPRKLTHACLGALARRQQTPEWPARVRDSGTDDVPSRDPVMRALLARVDRAATVSSTVLITGESGTGKEVLARRIHRLSARPHGPFMPVNCGGLPETLMDSELFGYKKGAFTGALADRKGLIEEARGGILFLDEVGDAPLAMQGRLLRFLDSGEVRAVGGSAIKHVDLRVIAATNRTLLWEMREKRFREDLFFRLNVVAVRLPPLRERRVDIPLLIDAHVRRMARKLALPVPTVSDEAFSLLLRYDWPGNIRELQNALEQALVQGIDRMITPLDLPEAVQGALMATITTADVMPDDDYATMISTLQRHHGKHGEAAAALGISRTTLWRRLRHAGAPLV